MFAVSFSESDSVDSDTVLLISAGAGSSLILPVRDHAGDGEGVANAWKITVPKLNSTASTSVTTPSLLLL